MAAGAATSRSVLYRSFCLSVCLLFFLHSIYSCVLGFGALVVLSSLCMWFNLSSVNSELRLCLFIVYMCVFICRRVACFQTLEDTWCTTFSIPLLSFLLLENQFLFSWRLESNAKQSLWFCITSPFFVYYLIVEELQPILNLLDNLNIFIFLHSNLFDCVRRWTQILFKRWRRSACTRSK